MLPEDPSDEQDDFLSSDPDEAMRIENELLKLKMQAELGAQFGGDTSDLPPDVENEFLKQMIAFEESMKNNPPVRLSSYLGEPVFPSSDGLSSEELTKEYEQLETLLHGKGIRVDFLAEYAVKHRYDYITKEAFKEDIHPPVMDGQFLVFTYEDAHPNHFYDMERRVAELLEDIFNNKVTQDSWYLADALTTPKGDKCSKKQFIERIEAFHDQFTSIGDHLFIVEHSFRHATTEERPETDTGFIEGRIRYDVVHKDGSAATLNGPCKVQLQLKHGWWEIYSFHLYGFSW